MLAILVTCSVCSALLSHCSGTLHGLLLLFSCTGTHRTIDDCSPDDGGRDITSTLRARKWVKAPCRRILSVPGPPVLSGAGKMPNFFVACRQVWHKHLGLLSIVPVLRVHSFPQIDFNFDKIPYYIITIFVIVKDKSRGAWVA